MKIVVITGSPHRRGTSSLLADQFIQGAQEAGHEVTRFDAAFQKVHPCIACDKCRNEGKGCVFQDDMETLNPALFQADLVAFVSPIYYYDWTAQIKAVMDRFYANNEGLMGGKKAVLMVTMEDETIESALGATVSFQGMTDYLQWERVGMVTAVGCTTLEDIQKTDFPRQAYQLGKGL